MKGPSVTGERVCRYTVKGFELAPNCLNLPPVHGEMAPTLRELAPNQMLSPKANVPFT